MQIEKPELLLAAAKAGISKHQAEELWNALDGQPVQDVPRFDLSNVLYYFGAMIVIIAMGWFLGVAWDSFGGGAIFSISLAYILLFITFGEVLWRRDSLKIPGGLCITVAVCLIPLAVYSLQKWTGWWIAGKPGEFKEFISWVKGGWFAMEIATVIGGCIALNFYRFPFLTAPIFFTLWFMSMDITPLVFKNSNNLYDCRLWVSLGFGIAMLIGAYLTDLSTRKDFAFWGYLFGLAAFWMGLSLLEKSSEVKQFVYCLINIGLVLLSVFLQRSVFLIFGALGVLIYITRLFYRHFSHSAWFPIILSVIGVFVILAGLEYHLYRKRIESFFLNMVPRRIQPWLPK